MFRRIAIPALIALSAPAQAGPGNCRASASDMAAGQTVAVRFAADQSGTITSREAEWDLAAPGTASLTLKLRYIPPANNALGPVTVVSVYVLGQRSPLPLAGATATLESATGKRWSAPLQSMFGTGIAQLSLKTPWGKPVNPQLAETIESTTAVTVTLNDHRRQPLETLALTPSDHGVRDRLFAEAAARALALAAAPAPCA